MRQPRQEALEIQTFLMGGLHQGKKETGQQHCSVGTQHPNKCLLFLFLNRSGEV